MVDDAEEGAQWVRFIDDDAYKENGKALHHYVDLPLTADDDHLLRPQ